MRESGCRRISRIMELREGAAQTEAFRVAGVNSGDERGHKAIQEFGAELPAHECGDGLINFRSAGGANASRAILHLVVGENKDEPSMATGFSGNLF